MHLRTAALAAALLAAAWAAGGGAAVAAASPAVEAASLPPFSADTSLLVVAPHPDDETLCCGGIVQRVLHAGGHVTVVWITSGDAERTGLLLIERVLWNPARARQFGAQRMAEARAATARLGVPRSGQLFLGYPDGGVRELLGEYRTTPYTSRTTGKAAVPYPDALFPGHPYTGDSLERDFAAVLEHVQPTLILAPSPADCHPDHRAAGLLTIGVSGRHAMLPRVRYWIVHGGEGWPSPRALMAGVPLTPPPRSRGLAPAPFALLPAEEDGKLDALGAYATQLRVMAPFLLAFVRTTELFSARAAADPPALQPLAP